MRALSYAYLSRIIAYSRLYFNMNFSIFEISTLATIKSPVFLGTLCKCKAGRFSAQNPPGTRFFRRFAARRRSGSENVFARQSKKIPKMREAPAKKNGLRLFGRKPLLFYRTVFHCPCFLHTVTKKLLSAAAAADNYYRDKNDDPAVIVAEERIKAAHCTASLH